MSDETITLPLDVVLLWRDSLYDDAAEEALVNAIDAVLWKPKPGVYYKASEHRPSDDQVVFTWLNGIWSSCRGRYVRDNELWMLQPPAPAYDPSEDDS